MVTVPNGWAASGADQDIELITSPTSGNWLVAIVASRVVDGSAPVLSVGDISRNYWTLLATDTTWAHGAHATAQLQIEVWACPAARYDGWPWLAVYGAASQITAYDVGTSLLSVSEVSGLTGLPTVDSITTATASASTTASISLPAPAGGAQCLMLVGAVTDNGNANPTASSGTALVGIGTAGASVSASMGGSWLTSTTAQTFSWTALSAVNWSIIGVSLKVTGATPPQPNPAWPGVQLQVGLGYDLSTPLSRVKWTDQSTRLLAVTADRGIQAELGAAQQGTIDLEIRNQDGAYTPRLVTASASATGAGSTTTILLPSTTSPLNIGDFFRLQNSSGVLKELNAFQVTGLSTAGGTTTVTFTRADGSGGALAATTTGDIYAGIKMDLYMPVRVLAYWQGKPYPVASGWLRDMPITYSDAAWATVQGVAGDAIETLTAAPPTALRGEILRRNPSAYWPLSDAAGAGAGQNVSGVTTSVLTQATSKYGAGVATAADFGQQTQGVDPSSTSSHSPPVSLVGDSSTCWRQSGQTSAELVQNGYALVALDSAFPAVANGVTIMGVTLTTLPDSNVVSNGSIDPTMLMVRTADPGAGIAQGSVIKLSLQKANFLPGVTVWDKNTHASTLTNISSGVQIVGGWRFWTLAFTQTNWWVYAGDSLVGSGTCNLVPKFTSINVGGEADQFWNGRSFPAYHAHVAIFPRLLTAGEIGACQGAMAAGEPVDEDAGNRIQRKLQVTGWRGGRILGSSVPVLLSAEADPSGTVADAAAEYAGYSDSLTFADSAGQFHFRSRNMTYQQSVRAAFGENTASGEIPYKAGMQPSFNPTFIYNSVSVENSTIWGEQPTVTNSITAADDTSASRYGTRSLTKQTRFNADQDAWHEAWWLTNRYAYPQLRVEQITVEASAYPAAWPTVLGIEVGDLVTVTRRQIGAPALTMRCRVQRVQPHLQYGAGGQVQGSVTLTLGAAPPIVGIAGDPFYGVLGNVNLGA